MAFLTKTAESLRQLCLSLGSVEIKRGTLGRGVVKDERGLTSQLTNDIRFLSYDCQQTCATSLNVLGSRKASLTRNMARRRLFGTLCCVWACVYEVSSRTHDWFTETVATNDTLPFRSAALAALKSKHLLRLELVGIRIPPALATALTKVRN